ncbi:hypothetical protein DL95DRAFT_400218 [Leptodontidium sp. 2 PMI_412]|nr:hypothetical protein DL95DRAFT_400218 [Leptodontidium sp. 2 PMI_412]
MDPQVDDPEIIKIKVYVPNTPYDRKYRLPRARWRSGNTPYNYHVRYGKVSNITVNSNKYLFEVAPENVTFSTDQFAPSILAVYERAWLLSQFQNLDRIVVLCNQGVWLQTVEEVQALQSKDLAELQWTAQVLTTHLRRTEKAIRRIKKKDPDWKTPKVSHNMLMCETEKWADLEKINDLDKRMRLFIELMHNSNNGTDESWLGWRDVDSNDEIVEWEYSDDEKYLEDEDRGQLDVQSNVPEVTRSKDFIRDEDITFRDFFETLAIIIVACFVSLSALIDYGMLAFLAWLGSEFDDKGYNCGADLDLVLDLLPYGMPSGQERI